MSDIETVLPNLTPNHAALFSTLEQHYKMCDLLILEPVEISKHCRLPMKNVTDLKSSILAALRMSVGDGSVGNDLRPVHSISTLSTDLDSFLGGGFKAGHVTEIVGESGIGKTQLLLSLMLAVQLPPPHGLGRPAIHVCTEGSLVTGRLEQILRNNTLLHSIRLQQQLQENYQPTAHFATAGTDSRMIGPLTFPSLDQILSTSTPDLESQEHILTYQVPLEVVRRNAGLLILDSVAANYRAEFERVDTVLRDRGLPLDAGTTEGYSNSMARRSTDLVKLGHLLQNLATQHNMAVVVANQVSDHIPTRFTGRNVAVSVAAQSTQQFIQHLIGNPHSHQIPPASVNNCLWTDMVGLDHQQRWISGWGDDTDDHGSQKQPALGLVWSSQLSCRLALIRRFDLVPPKYTNCSPSAEPGKTNIWRRHNDDELNREQVTSRRWLKIVFSHDLPPSGQGIHGAAEFAVRVGGLEYIERH